MEFVCYIQKGMFHLPVVLQLLCAILAYIILINVLGQYTL